MSPLPTTHRRSNRACSSNAIRQKPPHVGNFFVQESSQQLHENDFVDGDDDFEPLPVSLLVSDDDEFCDFIRMNTHDPFDD